MLTGLRKNKNNKSGFSMVEALIAAVIFAVAVVGVFATSAALKKPTVVSDKKLTAAYIGKQVLEDLRSKVDQREWLTGSLATYNLALGDHGPFTFNNPTYQVAYNVMWTVSSVPNSDARQVLVTIQWPD